MYLRKLALSDISSATIKQACSKAKLISGTLSFINFLATSKILAFSLNISLANGSNPNLIASVAFVFFFSLSS